MGFFRKLFSRPLSAIWDVVVFAGKVVVLMAVAKYSKGDLRAIIAAGYLLFGDHGGDAEGRTSEAFMINSRSTIAPIPMVYGERRVGGAVVFNKSFSSGGGNSSMVVIVALCEGEIESIGDVYFNGVISTHEQFKNSFEIKKHLGSPGQTADSSVIGWFPGVWTTDHRLDSTAYVVVRLIQPADAPVWSGIPLISCDVKGKKVYDPRSGLTVWSDNPILIARDFLLNTVYGVGVDPSQVDEAEVILSANHCDEMIADTSPEGSHKRYTCNTQILPSDNLIPNMLILLQGANASLIYSGGLYKIHSERVTAPRDFDITDDEIVGQIVVGMAEKANIFNRVNAEFFNPKKEWKEDIYVAEDAALRASEDDGVLMRLDIRMHVSTNPYETERLAKILLKQSRHSTRMKVTVGHIGLDLVPTDVVRVSYPTLGWVDGAEKLFRVTRVQIRQDFLVDLELMEYDDSIYDSVTDYVADTTEPSEDLDFTSVEAPTGLVLKSGNDAFLCLGDGTLLPRIKVEWTGSVDPFLREYDVQWRKVGEPWSSFQVDGDIAEAYLLPVLVDEAYDVRVRARNRRDYFSPWLEEFAYVIEDSLFLPPQPTNFLVAVSKDGELVFSWQPGVNGECSQLFAGFRLFMAYGYAYGLREMREVRAGFVYSQMTAKGYAKGTYTFAVVAEDKRGVQSLPTFLVAYVPSATSRYLLGHFHRVNNDWDALSDTWDGLPDTWDSITPTVYEGNPYVDDVIVVAAEDRWFYPMIYGTLIASHSWDDLEDSWDVLADSWDTLPKSSVLFEMQTGTDADGDVVGAWSPLQEVGARYIRFRATVTGVNAHLSELHIHLDEATTELRFPDINTATEPESSMFHRIEEGHFLIGSNSDTLQIVEARIDALQSGEAGVNWGLLSKAKTLSGNPAAEFKVWDKSHNLLNEVVDVTLIVVNRRIV